MATLTAMPLPPRFGARLRFLREGRQLSQEALAKLCDLVPNTISRWEVGTTSPSLADAVLVAKALEVPLAVLAGEKEPAAEVPLVRLEPLYFVNPGRLEALRAAKTPAETQELFRRGIAVCVEPDDLMVAKAQYEAAERLIHAAKLRPLGLRSRHGER